MKIRMFRSLTRSKGRGFTLLEMMLVVVIMGVLIGVAAVNILGRGKAAKIGATKASMSTTASMIKNYNLEQGVYPATLDNLVPKYMEKIPLDAWKRPLVYIASPSGGGATGTHPFTLYSTGESGETGGADVIDYWEEEAASTPH
jgi:general secretion pathway protein G